MRQLDVFRLLPPPPRQSPLDTRLSKMGGCLRSRPFRAAVGVCDVIQVVGLAFHLPAVSARILLAIGLLQAPSASPVDATDHASTVVCLQPVAAGTMAPALEP